MPPAAAIRTPTGASSSPTAASCTPTATGCSARSTTPRTPSRTRCCARGAGLPRFEGRSSLRSWLYRIATNACLNAIERRPKRVLPIDHGPPADPHDPPGSAARRVDVGRALSRRAARARGRPRRPRGPLRAPRERRAGLRRGAPAPAAQPARRAHPARGARLLGPGDRRGARDDRRRGQQRPAARAQGGRRAPARPQPAGHAARARRPAPARDRRGLHGRDGARRRRRRRRPAGAGRRVVDAAAGAPGTAGVDEIAVFLATAPLNGDWRWRHLPAQASGQAAVGSYVSDAKRRHLSSRSRSTC